MKKRFQNPKRLLKSLFLLGLLSTLVSAWSYALWTSTSASSANLFATPSIAISSDKVGTAIATLSNMVPGDSIAGLTRVTNSSSEDLAGYSVVVSVTAPALPNALTIDTTNGLQLLVKRCSVAWTSGTPVSASTCGGTQTTVYNGPITNGAASGTYTIPLATGSNFWCSPSGSASERTARGVTCDPSLTGNQDYLLMVVSLPANAASSEQGLSTTLSFTFSGQQPPAHAF